MKKISFIFCILLISMFFANAQNEERQWGTGILAGTNAYNGNLGSNLFTQPMYFYGGFSVARFINSSIDIGIQAGYGDYGYWNHHPQNFLTKKYDSHLLLKYKLNNGYILPKGPVTPFVTTGVGIAGYTEGRNYNTDNVDIFFPAGFGLRVDVLKWMALQYQFVYNFSLAESRTLSPSNIQSNMNDGYFQQSLGIVILFGKEKDEDKDGVADKYDKCPGTTLGVEVDEHGCPLDKDKDGVPDYLDECPDVWGLAELKGCPDKDKDGITDHLDDCPDVWGLPQFNGCPDTDGDGIPDHLDDCPDVWGLPQFNGCPDTDGDGIPDHLDDCPNIPGVPENNGCPEIEEKTKKIFEQALTGIQFKTGSSIIERYSYPILDNVAKIMIENPQYFLEIYGHTDNVGKPEMNLKLSEERAISVLNYLKGKGIDEKRMIAKGFGETLPIDDNNTNAGRQRNRRVEFKVVFEY